MLAIGRGHVFVFRSKEDSSSANMASWLRGCPRDLIGQGLFHEDLPRSKPVLVDTGLPGLELLCISNGESPPHYQLGQTSLPEFRFLYTMLVVNKKLRACDAAMLLT